MQIKTFGNTDRLYDNFANKAILSPCYSHHVAICMHIENFGNKNRLNHNFANKAMSLPFGILRAYEKFQKSSISVNQELQCWN